MDAVLVVIQALTSIVAILASIVRTKPNLLRKVMKKCNVQKSKVGRWLESGSTKRRVRFQEICPETGRLKMS